MKSTNQVDHQTDVNNIIDVSAEKLPTTSELAEITPKETAIAPVPPSESGINQALQHYGTIINFVQQIFQQDVDFGVIPGTKKPTLYKSGAEKLVKLFGLHHRLELVSKIEDFTGKSYGLDFPLFTYHYKCQLLNKAGDIIAEGEATCSSAEWKYKKQGVQGIWNSQNTICKIAQKRCLGSTTPVFIRTERGELRTDMEGLHDIYHKSDKPVWIAGTKGEWRLVKASVKDTNREVFKITLRDGSYIRATGNHVFPTVHGEMMVQDLKVGDSLLRETIPLYSLRSPLPKLGKVVGLFLAEGSYSNTKTGVRFTLNGERLDLLHLIKEVAEYLGLAVNIQGKEGNCFDVNVYGDAFFGLIKQFINGDSAYTKHLSRYCWRQSPEFLKEVLEGYLQGDGSWTERKGCKPFWRIGFTGKNKELEKDLRCLCNILDLKISLKTSYSHCNGKKFLNLTGWIKEKYESYNQCNLEEIISIEKETKPASVYDIEVDGEHLFLLGNGIVTHNSLVAAVLVGCGASEFFTQDLEDMSDRINSEPAPKTQPKTSDFGDLTKQELIEQSTGILNQLGWSKLVASKFAEKVTGKKVRAEMTTSELSKLIAAMLSELEKQNQQKAAS